MGVRNGSYWASIIEVKIKFPLRFFKRVFLCTFGIFLTFSAFWIFWHFLAPFRICSRRACLVEGHFIGTLFMQYLQGYTVEQQFKHSNGFEPNSDNCPTQVGIKSEKACCSDYPTRFTYKSYGGDRQCCGNKTYRAFMKAVGLRKLTMFDILEWNFRPKPRFLNISAWNEPERRAGKAILIRFYGRNFQSKYL